MDKTPEDEKGEPPPLTVKRDLGFLPIPHRARHDPDHPPRFSLALNLLFGIASTITVANLYYVQPLLAKLASSFDVSYSEISLVPTLLQAGYATGLLLISPLGDLVRRRPLVLLLLILTTGLSIGLALASSIKAFEALSFLIGVFTVTPQILLPLSADLAPPDRKASAISITLSGLLLGLLFARVFAGVIAEFASYRIVYWTATGLQAGLLLCIYIVLPDYPSKNVHGDLTYFKILWTMAKYAVTEPVLVQSCLIGCVSSACFSSFWITLTFLLTDVYHFSTLSIGLFALIGIVGVCTAPFVGRAVDRVVPWVGTLVGLSILMLANVVEVVGGGLSIAAVVICTFTLDVGQQSQQVSNSARVFAINPAARSRLNAVQILALFIGQVMGTIAGSHVYIRYGWRASSGLNVVWVGWNFLVLFARGPHQHPRKWLGWGGNYSLRKDRPPPGELDTQAATSTSPQGTLTEGEEMVEMKRDDDDDPACSNKTENIA